MPDDDRAQLAGSERAPASGTRVLAQQIPAGEPVEVTLTLRGRPLPEGPAARGQDAVLADFAADPGDADAVRRVLERYGLAVTDVSLPTRSVVARGTAAQLHELFGVDFVRYQNDEQGEFRGRRGALSVPAELAGIVTGIFGLDERRVARRRVADPAAAVQLRPLTPGDIEQRYSFPAGDASGQTVAIAEFGGAYFADDTAAYCHKFGTPVPTVTPISAGYPLLTAADIAALPASQQQEVLDESVEVMMDVELVAGLCPAADVNVYFAPFTEKGWVDLLDAVMTAATPPVALSVSWGLAEDSTDWSKAAVTEINLRLQAAAQMGITVCVAAGDDGAGDQESDGRAHVNFPASSPWVLAVGGTQLTGGQEVVWWEPPGDRAHGGASTGGGVSTVFPRPSWQDVHVASLNIGAIDGRVVPDVAAIAGEPYYDMIFQGADSPNGGTSAAAPVWASLIARVAAGSAPGTPQFLTPLLYAPGPGGEPVGTVVCTDVTSGDNRSTGVDPGYAAQPGFDAVTGWGTPKGSALQAQLAG